MSPSVLRSVLRPVAIAMLVSACATQDIPQAHKGQLFQKTGLFRLYSGPTGFTGDVLGPGTYRTGVYGDIQMIDCSMVTESEPLAAQTKDGVQFGLEISVRFSADCSPTTVRNLLATVIPDQNQTISGKKLYDIYVKPTISEAVLQVVSPYRATEINDKRQEILTAIRKRFLELIEAKQHIQVFELNLSKPQFPRQIDDANVERAVQAIMRDKAIAERERVNAEIETSQLKRQLADSVGAEEAARIERIGAALRRNPEYLQYDLQSKMPEIYREAGASGNMVIAAPNPTISTPARGAAVGRPAAASPYPPAPPARQTERE
jgi:regulator of protease activity HflC (stomatin/prohibitin superfamily)